MLTVDRVRSAWKAIVESVKGDVAFISVWSKPKDDDEALRYPAAWWQPIPTTSLLTAAHHRQDLFTISMAFMAQTDTARTSDERDAAHAKMEAIARLCWYRFTDLYIINSTLVDGVLFDFAQDATATFTPFWDHTGKHVTGVTFSTTLRSNTPSICLDDYFG